MTWCRSAPLKPARFLFVPSLCLALSLLASLARAQQDPPAESERGWPGVVRVGLPTPTYAPVVTVAGLGYGWMDRSAPVEGGQRLRGSLAVAVNPLPNLSLSGDFQSRWDHYAEGPEGAEANLYSEPRVGTRYSLQVSPSAFLGLEGDLRLVGAEAPSIKPSATSPAVRGLLGARLAPGTWLGARLGFHLDRSERAVPDPGVLTAPDERTLGASSWNAVQWGLGTSHRLSPSKTELLGELSGELLVGGGAPSAAQSPYRLSVGARQPFGRALALAVTAEVDLSKRTLAGDDLMPIDPRVSAGVTLIWRLGLTDDGRPTTSPPAHKSPKKGQAPAPPRPPATPSPPPALQTTPVSGTVVDEGGRPLADVEIKLVRESGEPVIQRTFADGGFEFADVPEGRLELQVSTPGFDSITLAIGAEEERVREIVLRPSVPAGQVRGKVLDLQGRPIAATINVTPGDHSVLVQPDGSFELELAPGQYTVRFQHTDYAPQRRSIRVHDRGVVILNIALMR